MVAGVSAVGSHWSLKGFWVCCADQLPTEAKGARAITGSSISGNHGGCVGIVLVTRINGDPGSVVVFRFSNRVPLFQILFQIGCFGSVVGDKRGGRVGGLQEFSVTLHRWFLLTEKRVEIGMNGSGINWGPDSTGVDGGCAVGIGGGVGCVDFFRRRWRLRTGCGGHRGSGLCSIGGSMGLLKMVVVGWVLREAIAMTREDSGFRFVVNGGGAEVVRSSEVEDRGRGGGDGGGGNGTRLFGLWRPEKSKRRGSGSGEF